LRKAHPLLASNDLLDGGLDLPHAFRYGLLPFASLKHEVNMPK